MKHRTRFIAVTAGLATAAALGVATAVFAHPGAGQSGRGGGMCGGQGWGPWGLGG